MRPQLAALREEMARRKIDAYVVTSADAHARDNAASFWHGRQWLSGFMGSAGLMVVTADSAGLWTDGRYFIQAETELNGSGIDLFREREPGVPSYTKFLANCLPAGGKVGFDGRTVMVSQFKKLKTELTEKKISFAYDEDLLAEIWKDRPTKPTGKAFVHPLEFACAFAAEKLADVRKKMRAGGIDTYLVTSLESVAWLANLRGSDVPNTPVVYAFALVTEDAAHLFVEPGKVEPEMVPDFEIHEYNEFPDFLKTCGKVHFNPQSTNVLLADAIEKCAELAPNTDIVLNLKAQKSPGELANIKNAYLREGVVLVKTFAWLAGEMAKGATIYEGDVVRFLQNLRSADENYLSDSFDTICAFMGNAAMVHYNCGEQGAKLEPGGFLLIDTGGQYLDGTTDTTRTIWLAPDGNAISPTMKRDFTLVLRGNMELGAAAFPIGTTGFALDILARRAMWEAGQNYLHGTGHGVGYCLGVHEGPQRIAQVASDVPLAPGMLISNEPGIYKQDRYGIRIENILYVREKETTPDGKFLCFENLTLCPIDTRAVKLDLITPLERERLNDYHRKVYEALSPHLSPDERDWLKTATEPI